MTIQQGIAYNRRRELNRRRKMALETFHHFAKDHRSVAGLYTGGNVWADREQAKIREIDAELKQLNQPTP